MNSSQNHIRHILIIDDHQIYLDGLEMLLSHSLSHTNIYKADSLDMAQQVLLKKPDMDLILLDLKINNNNGFDFCTLNELKHQPIVILSASENPKDVEQAISLGLLGFLNKASDNQALISNINILLEGEHVFPDIARSSVSLTPRQKDVLFLLAEGYPNKVICKKLSLSEATVKTHLRTLFNILDVHTRTQCVNVAREFKLI